MAFWKWCLCLSLLVVVASEDSPKNFNPLEILSVKFLPYQQKELPGLSELAKKLYTATEQEQVAILNEYVDDLLVNLNAFILEKGLDPVPLPGFEESFKWTIFRGWVGLYDGWLRGLGTISRTGDVIVKYSYPTIKIHMVLGFSKLTFDYHYEAKFMGLGPSGTADGGSKGSKFTLDLSLNMANLRANLDKFRLNTIGKITFKFDGGVVGDMANVLIGVVLPILKPILNIVLDGFINDGLEVLIGTYNNFICTLLGDCPQEVLPNVFNTAYVM